MEFEELIKSLRIHGNPNSSCDECIMHGLDVRKCGKVLCNEAADAIEELSREYESIAASLNESVELVRKLQNRLKEE